MTTRPDLLAEIRKLRFATEPDSRFPELASLDQRSIALDLIYLIQDAGVDRTDRTRELSSSRGRNMERILERNEVLSVFFTFNNSRLCLSDNLSADQWKATIDEVLREFPDTGPLWH